MDVERACELLLDAEMVSRSQLEQIASLLRSQQGGAAELRQKLEAAEAERDTLRRQFEQYVRKNCSLIRHSVADGLGYPDEVEGKCGGYAQLGDEPHWMCQECVAGYNPDEATTTGTSLLARLEAAEEVARAAEEEIKNQEDGGWMTATMINLRDALAKYREVSK